MSIASRENDLGLSLEVACTAPLSSPNQKDCTFVFFPSSPSRTKKLQGGANLGWRFSGSLCQEDKLTRELRGVGAVMRRKR